MDNGTNLRINFDKFVNDHWMVNDAGSEIFEPISGRMAWWCWFPSP